ncbi:MAG: NAD(+)/NADH kinase [Coriobacteriales bacterium]
MKVLIVVNSGKENASRKSVELQKWLEAKGVESSMINANDIFVNGLVTDRAKSAIEGVELVCSLGGDGTLMSSAQLVFDHPAPVLGFNFGHLGFLTGATPDSMFEAVQAALNHKLDEEVRCALNITLENYDGTTMHYTALNEVAITRGITGKMINFDITIDGDLLSSIRADGAIVSSPSGSTAYSLSAGGPILSPTLSCMVVVALAPHSLISRALVTGEDETVCILPEETSGKDCSVFIDGNLVRVQKSPKSIVATVRKDAITLLKYNVPGFTRAASRAFFGGTND